MRDDDNASVPFLECDHECVQTLEERDQTRLEKIIESNLDIKMICRLIDRLQSFKSLLIIRTHLIQQQDMRPLQGKQRKCHTRFLTTTECPNRLQSADNEDISREDGKTTNPVIPEIWKLPK